MAPSMRAKALNSPSSTSVMRRVAVELLTSCFMVATEAMDWSLSTEYTAARTTEVSAAGSTRDLTTRSIWREGFWRNVS